MLGFALSLASGLSWGVSDFLGGLQSRRMSVLAVLAVTQPVGLIFALIFAAFFADAISAGKLGIAAGAGAAGVAALGAFYAAMAMGTMSIVAPIAALGVAVPVGAGLAGGEEPGPVQLVGLVVAVVGVVVLSYEEEDDPESGAVARRAIALAAFAALGFGLFFTGLDVAATDRPGWAVVAARLGGVAAIAAGVLVVRPALRPVAAALPVLVAIGGFDILANALFAVASTIGLLPVVAVGGSMYPAFTIALAHLFLGERLNRPQRAGVALALAGVILIAGGA